MKRKLAFLISFLMIFAFVGLTGCGSSDEEAAETEATEATEATEPAVDGSAYGYVGDDPVECAVYQYLAEEVAKNYDVDEDDVSVPAVRIIDKVENDDGTTDVYGDFWVFNYELEEDEGMLECESGGNYPGVMHVAKDGDIYAVTGFDQVEDGGNFEPSAKEIFGDMYDEFMEVYSDSDGAEAARAKILADYVKANGLNVTKYKDYGWDPVELEL